MTIKTCVFNKLMSKTAMFTLIYFTESLQQQQPRELEAYAKIVAKDANLFIFIDLLLTW